MSGRLILHEPLEQRLRDALEFRASAVGLDDLRPGAPPTRPGRSVLPGRRTVAVLFALATAVASIVFVFAERNPETPVSPATPPSLSPTPTTTPTSSRRPPPPSGASPATSFGQAQPADGAAHATTGAHPSAVGR